MRSVLSLQYGRVGGVGWVGGWVGGTHPLVKAAENAIEVMGEETVEGADGRGGEEGGWVVGWVISLDMGGRRIVVSLHSLSSFSFYVLKGRRRVGGWVEGVRGFQGAEEEGEETIERGDVRVEEGKTDEEGEGGGCVEEEGGWVEGGGGEEGFEEEGKGEEDFLVHGHAGKNLFFLLLLLFSSCCGVSVVWVDAPW